MQYDLQIRQISKGHYVATSRRSSTFKVYGNTIKETLNQAQYLLFQEVDSHKAISPVA